MKTIRKHPAGDLVLRTLAMPADTNANGNIFGGWLMSQMDLGGAIFAKEIARGNVVTVKVDSMCFLKPASIGDVVCCYARCLKTGKSSLIIAIEVWVKKVTSEPIGERYCVTEGIFTYVAVDSDNKSRPLAEHLQHYDATIHDVSQIRTSC